MPQSRRGVVFFVLALPFLAIGIASNRTFLALALVFLVIGIVLMRRPAP